VRRQRDLARRSGTAAGPDGVVRRVVREARDLKGPLDAELWASQLLGVFWRERYSLPLEEAASPDYSLVLGEPLIEAVARLGKALPSWYQRTTRGCGRWRCSELTRRSPKQA
jgi:hypothetical protein